MANEKWRLDLKGDIRQAVAAADGFGIENLETHDYQEHAERVLAAVLPHFEAAYERGEVAGKSKAGHRLTQENERLRRELKFAEQCLNERDRA